MPKWVFGSSVFVSYGVCLPSKKILEQSFKFQSQSQRPTIEGRHDLKLAFTVWLRFVFLPQMCMVPQ